MLFNRFKYTEVVWIGTRVPIFLKAVFDVSPGIREGLLYPRLPHNLPGKGNTTTLFGLPRATTSSVFKKIMGRMNFSRLFRYWPRDSSFLVRIYPIMRTQVVRLCIHKDLLPEGTIANHVVTCQVRDHIVIIRTGCRNLVVVNAHLEPEWTLRRLRERLRLITPHWPLYPEAVGLITGDLNMCEPEEGRFNVWNQSFSEGDTERPLSSTPFFLMSSKSLSLTSQGETLQLTVLFAHCPGLIGPLSISPWLKHETFTATPTSSRIW